MVVHEHEPDIDGWIQDWMFLFEDRMADEKEDLQPAFQDGVIVYIGPEDNEQHWFTHGWLRTVATNVYERIEHAIMSSMLWCARCISSTKRA